MRTALKNNFNEQIFAKAIYLQGYIRVKIYSKIFDCHQIYC